MTSLLSPRMIFLSLPIIAAVSMAIAVFYMERYLGLSACPLCMTQRACIVLVGLIGLIAAIHNPAHWGRRIYAVLAGTAAMAGAAVAGRHLWLQQLPEDQVPACGPSLEYMLETLPLSETWHIVMMGDGNCADVSWTFLGLSIPGQTLLLFSAVIALCIWQLLRRD